MEVCSVLSPVKIADAIGSVIIAIPSKIFLNGSFGSSMRLGGHDRLVAHDTRCGVLFFSEEAVEDGHVA